MLLDLLPKLGILFNSDLLRLVVDKFVQAAQIHVLGEQGDNVFVEGLPVRVFEVVFLTLILMLEGVYHEGGRVLKAGVSIVERPLIDRISIGEVLMSLEGREKQLTLSCA